MSADDFDVDAELLAMAGDSSDDDVSDVDQTRPIETSSASEEAKPSVEKVEEPEPSRRGVAQKVRKRGRKKVSRQEIEDELNDLGDDSSSPPASLGSGAMDESNSEADALASSDVDNGPLYPLEGKFMSTRDRDEIMALPEIRREEILAERAQEVLLKQQDLQLKKVLAAAKAKASKHKRKAAAADLDDGGLRKSSRPRTEKRSALDDYKKARELKGTERNSRFDQTSDRRDVRSPSPASDRDADGESEVEWAEPSSDSRRDKDEPLAELKDFDRCRVGRSNFAKVCFYPNFETALKGCFCRVSIGLDRETGQNMYRMTQIKGFTEGKPYRLEGSNGRQFTTDQYALVAHGSAEKPWPFSACSDSKFTDVEFQHYRDALEKERVRVPRRAWLKQKLEDIHAFLNVKWNDQNLQVKFARQRAMEKKFDPATQLSAKRQVILKRKTEAQETEDAEEVVRCDAELAALENNTSNGVNGSTTKAKVSQMKANSAQTQQERLALLNQRNRGKNQLQVRNSLLEERRKIHKERERTLAEAKAKAKAEAEQKAAEEERKKRESLLAAPSEMSELFGDTPEISRAGTPLSGIGTPKPRRSRAGTPLNGIKKEKSGLGLLGAKKKLLDEDLDLDLGIDVEI